MRKLLQEAKAFGTVIGLAALGVAFLLGIAAWEHMKWSDCLASHSAVLTEAEIHTLAGKIAALSPDEAAEFDRSLIGIKAERARKEEERVAELRAMTDTDLLYHVLREATEYAEGIYADVALAMLRDAGFIRGATLHEAYRAGYERYGYEHLGDGHPLQDDDASDFISARDYDLRELAKDREVPAYMKGEA